MFWLLGLSGDDLSQLGREQMWLDHATLACVVWRRPSLNHLLPSNSGSVAKSGPRLGAGGSGRSAMNQAYVSGCGT
jgi:hypothetical protein